MFFIEKKNSFHEELATSRPILAVFLTFLNQWLAVFPDSFPVASLFLILTRNACLRSTPYVLFVVLGTSRYLSPVGGGDGEFGGITFFRGTKGDESSPFR